MTNHKPIIKGRDIGIWRRILLIPFIVSIPLEEQDKDLKVKLLSELPGILNWALEGCLSYQCEGLRPPKDVLAAGELYKAEMDLVNQFIEECCEIHTGLKVKLKELYQVYIEWCKSKGIGAWGVKRLQQELKLRGYYYRNSTGNHVYVFGLNLSGI